MYILLILVSTASIGGGVFFQASVLLSIDNATFWPILANRCKVTHFLGPRGPLVEPSMSVHPSATIFPEFIDEL